MKLRAPKGEAYNGWLSAQSAVELRQALTELIHSHLKTLRGVARGSTDPEVRAASARLEAAEGMHEALIPREEDQDDSSER
jgi:hypothetical protein